MKLFLNSLAPSIWLSLGYEGAILKQPCRTNKIQGQLPIQLQGQPQGPVAFLTFASRKDAELAKEKFQGFQLDPHADSVQLKIEFAKVLFDRDFFLNWNVPIWN